jgi:hypothetical protein
VAACCTRPCWRACPQSMTCSPSARSRHCTSECARSHCQARRARARSPVRRRCRCVTWAGAGEGAPRWVGRLQRRPPQREDSALDAVGEGRRIVEHVSKRYSPAVANRDRRGIQPAMFWLKFVAPLNMSLTDVVFQPAVPLPGGERRIPARDVLVEIRRTAGTCRTCR